MPFERQYQKYDTARHATGDMHLVCWMTKVTNTRSEYIILLVHGSNSFTNTTQCYVYKYFDPFA